MTSSPCRTFGSIAFFASRGYVMISRRFYLSVLSHLANRQFAFALATVSILSAKLVHIYAHIAAVPSVDIFRWGLSFFAQDTVLLLLLRLLFDLQLPLCAASNSLPFLATTLACLVTFAQLQVAAINISFFAITGSELRWRNIGLVADPSSWSMLLTGLLAYSIVFVAIFLVSWLLQDLCFGTFGQTVDVIKYPFHLLFKKISCCRYSSLSVSYNQIPQNEVDLDEVLEVSNGCGADCENRLSKNIVAAHQGSQRTWRGYVLIGFPLVVQAMLLAVRPVEKSLIFMSWTPILLPFIDFANSSPPLDGPIPHHSHNIGWIWENRTALTEPVRWNWLPRVSSPLPGFEDWYASGLDHYSANEDPLKVSNLDEELLVPLQGILEDVDIRHIVLIKLESTRKDVFPIKKGEQIWQVLAETWENGTFPVLAHQRLATLTPNSNFITGDYGDGFEHDETSRRGGINVNNDHTTSTYTLKSIVGTLCGLTPLVADFNVEYGNHIYQPCLPHIFSAFNELDHTKDLSEPTPGYTSYGWNSTFMMSVTNTFDKQDLLMPKLGYETEDLITKEYLQRDDAKFGKVTLPDINYYGMAEKAVEDYIKDAFKTAQERNGRVFLTHLTSTTHHPFNLPDEDPYIPLATDGKLDDLSHYVNTVGFVDRWLGKIFEILEGQGASNSTLVVLVGDHGLSIPETGAVTPYYQSNIGNFHVPLVISHPKLPPIDVDGLANSISILPTILDLLIETGSLSESERQAARDLIRNYEGQSLIRPLQTTSKRTGQVDWQFTVMNTGGAQVATRSANDPKWRLVAPVVEDVEWRFTNVEEDPHEMDPVLSFDFVAFLDIIKKKYGPKAGDWAEEAAFITRWWVSENRKRWRYNT